MMGEYYSRGRAMDQAGRANLKRQRDDFARTLREGLIRSYAKGFLAFGGARMEVQGVEASPQSARVASVTQLVYGEAERVYTIRYQMVVGACEISLSRPLTWEKSIATSSVRWPKKLMTTSIA